MKTQAKTIGAALGVALLYIGLHVYFLRSWTNDGVLPRVLGFLGRISALDREHQAALYLPAISWVIFVALHVGDYFLDLGGLVGRSRVKEHADNHDYADSALTRQAIYSAIGIGAIIGLVSVEKLWGGERGVVASCAVAALSTATLLAMVSVLCYAQSKRWKPDGNAPIRRHLLRRAKRFDEFSWYVLMVGLVWSLAIVHPGVAILANFGYGAALFLYYFQFREVKVETREDELWKKTAAAWDAAEAARQAAETQRQALEKQRHEAENARVSAETARAGAETLRQAPKPSAGHPA